MVGVWGPAAGSAPRVLPGARGRRRVLGLPVCRQDGAALAWVESLESRGARRGALVVMPTLTSQEKPLTWPLARHLFDKKVFWADPQKVALGTSLLEPSAVFSWNEYKVDSIAAAP